MQVYVIYTYNKDYGCFSSEDIINKLKTWILTNLKPNNDIDIIVKELLEDGIAFFTDIEGWDDVIYCTKLQVQ